MGASFGLSKARAAEVKRGLRFNERFLSQAEVEENGGTVTGVTFSDGVATFASNDNITYKNPLGAIFTIVGWFWIDSAQSNVRLLLANGEATGYGIGIGFYPDNTLRILYENRGWGSSNLGVPPTGQWIFFTYRQLSATASELFLNADTGTKSTFNTTPNLGTMILLGRSTGGFAGKLRNVKISNKLLSDVEVLSYYKNQMWLYDRNFELAAPMFSETDNIPASNYTQDRSGKGNHIAYSGCTFDKGAYSFDGVDDYFTNLPSVTGKYPYMLIDTGSGVVFSESSTVYNNVGSSGSFSGKVYCMFLSSIELNETQKIDLYNNMMSIYYQGKNGR